jgi:hypothetical protein
MVLGLFSREPPASAWPALAGRSWLNENTAAHSHFSVQ